MRCECPRFDWCFPCMGSVWHGRDTPYYSFCQLHCHCEYGRGIDAAGPKDQLLVNVETEQRSPVGSAEQRQLYEEANSPVSSIYESQPESPDQDEKNIQSQFLAPSEVVHWKGEAQSIDHVLSTKEKKVYKTVPFPGITVYQIQKSTQEYSTESPETFKKGCPESSPYLRASLYAYEVPLKFSR